MRKVVINKCYGGFCLSQEATDRYLDLRSAAAPSAEAAELIHVHVQRDCPILVQVVEELGEKAAARHARLKIVEIPDDVQWTIEEYDGLEWVAEVHRTWD